MYELTHLIIYSTYLEVTTHFFCLMKIWLVINNIKDNIK